MASRIKQYLLIAAAGAAVYFLMSHHIFIFSHQFWPNDIKFLKKTKLHLHDTFNSVNTVSEDRNRQVEVESLFKSKWLRQAGIGERLVAWQVISEERRRELESRYR
jgi:hypothetical protein